MLGRGHAPLKPPVKGIKRSDLPVELFVLHKPEKTNNDI